MWFKASLVVAVYVIVELNSKELNDSIRKLMEGGELNSSDMRTSHAGTDINAEQFHGRNSGSISGEELKFRDSNEMYNIDRHLEMLAKQRRSELSLIPEQSNKGIRLCGNRLVQAILDLCNGCVKPYGSTLVTNKRYLEKCDADDGLLAATAPCALTTNNRPAAARLILCPLNHRWNSFRAITDLFRHEIMHALGFGLITPRENSSYSPATREFFWTDESSSQRVASTYMDFQDDAVDELMTPVLSNGRNYLTKISASILEATKNGYKQWYKTNETLVQAETNAYWYGRNWGCIFVHRSCYEYIVHRLLQRKITFPFCDAIDLLNTQHGNKKYTCFSNGTKFTMVPMSCNVISSVRNSKIAFGLRARTLANHFKILSKSQFRNFYGSDGTHRYCPFVQEVLYDRMAEIPDDAEIVECNFTRNV